jgi:hypothetical protein
MHLMFPSDALLRASIAIGFPSMDWIRVLAELNGRREDPTAFLNGKTQKQTSAELPLQETRCIIHRCADE